MSHVVRLFSDDQLYWTDRNAGVVLCLPRLRISAVFNLTLPGEHPYCGDGLGASGFPYDPEKDLMAENSTWLTLC